MKYVVMGLMLIYTNHLHGQNVHVAVVPSSTQLLKNLPDKTVLCLDNTYLHQFVGDPLYELGEEGILEISERRSSGYYSSAKGTLLTVFKRALGAQEQKILDFDLGEELAVGVDQTMVCNEYVGLLLGRVAFSVYQKQGSQGYRKVREIIPQRDAQDWIRSCFANENFTKIILWWGHSHLMNVYQYVMINGEMSYQLTQEIRLDTMIDDVCVDESLRTITVHSHAGKMRTYRLRTQKISLNQMFLFSHIQTCLRSVQGRVWLRTHKQDILHLLELFAQEYGEWTVQGYQIPSSCHEIVQTFLMTHKRKLCGTLLLIVGLLCSEQYAKM